MNEEIERTTIVREPVQTVEVRRSSNAGWWVAALVAVIAVAALFVMFAGQTDRDELQAARDQGVAEATIANASQSAQQAAVAASQAAQNAAAGAAEATENAAQTAAQASQETADAATDAAKDASEEVDRF